MVRLITLDDITDTLLKIKQRGILFFLSKFNFDKKSRTISAFNKSSIISSNWWNIEMVKKRWNKKISGNYDTNFVEFIMKKIIKEKSKIKMISLGSGKCNYEFDFMKYNNISEILCLDISQFRISGAIERAKKIDKNNKLQFIVKDVKDYNLKENYFDLVLFNNSLHHFKNIDYLLNKNVFKSLRKGGIVVINEYVGPNRLQFPKDQIIKINEALNLVPNKYKKRFNSKMIKSKFYGSGILRMIVADPSECIESETILSNIHKKFYPIIEQPIGGNILMNVLKDISHNFIPLDDEKKKILEKLFDFEDKYLEQNNSDFIFGVYKKLDDTLS